MRATGPRSSFDDTGRPHPPHSGASPRGNRRMGANPPRQRRPAPPDLRRPDFRSYTVDVPAPGAVSGEDMTDLGQASAGCRSSMPRPATSGCSPPTSHVQRPEPVFEATGRRWNNELGGGHRSGPLTAG